jgi:hypothetical protein
MQVIALVLALAAVAAAVVLVVGLVRPATFGNRHRAGLILGPVAAALAVVALVLFAVPQYEVAQASADEPIVCGETTELLVEVQNAGLVGGTYASTYSLDGAAQEGVELAVDGHGSEVVGLPLPADLAPGEHTATVGDTTITFRALRPAKFVVEFFDVYPTMLKVGDRVKVYASVLNSGEVPGTFDGELLVDGEVEEAKPGEIQPGEVLKLEYTVKLKAAGKHQVKVVNERQKVIVVKPVRFENGHVIARHMSSGNGQLKLRNKKGRDDAVLVLTSTSSRKPLLAVYVRGGADATVSGIPDGRYRVHVSYGSDWNWYMGDFLTSTERIRFDDVLEFTTKSWTSSWSDAYYIYSQENYQYSGWTLTLYSSAGGTAKVDSLTADEFPKVE